MPNSDAVKDLIKVMSDKMVYNKYHWHYIFDAKLKTDLLDIENLKIEDNRLQRDLSDAQITIESLEANTRRDNPMIIGLPPASLAEAASATATAETSPIVKNMMFKFKLGRIHFSFC
jgi:hypothetical protein